MKIFLNGDSKETKPNQTLEQILEEHQLKEKLGIAIAVNLEVVHKSQWESWILKPADRIEIVSPFQGG